MKHARQDYDRIQDPAGKIPEKEPVFLLRGQDLAAPAAVRAWAMEHARIGGDSKLVVVALNQALKMDQWQRERARKIADAPLGPKTYACGDTYVFNNETSG